MTNTAPVDIDHLNRYTGGDVGLNAEILRLFDGQCREMLPALEALAQAGADAKRAKEIAHTLKGAARGVGAFGLADAAQAAESATNDRLALIAAVEQIRTRSGAVLAFIEAFLAASA